MSPRNPLSVPLGNATEGDVLEGKTFQSRGSMRLKKGTIPILTGFSNPASVAVTPSEGFLRIYPSTSTRKKYIPENETAFRVSEPNFIPSNIKKDVEMFNMIGTYEGSGGGGTGGNAIPSEVLATRTFTNDDGEQIGTMIDRTGITTVAGDSNYINQTLYLRPQKGYYDGSSSKVSITDNNFRDENIKKGVSIFGRTGTYESSPANTEYYYNNSFKVNPGFQSVVTLPNYKYISTQERNFYLIISGVVENVNIRFLVPSVDPNPWLHNAPFDPRDYITIFASIAGFTFKLSDQASHSVDLRIQAFYGSKDWSGKIVDWL